MLTRPTGYLTCPRCEGLYAQGRACPCDGILYPHWLRLLAWLAVGLFCVLACAGMALLGWWAEWLIGGQ